MDKIEYLRRVSTVMAGKDVDCCQGWGSTRMGDEVHVHGLSSWWGSTAG